MDTGTTACVILMTPQTIYCANAGDSRGVLMRQNKAIELSHDHKPQNDIEITRIRKA
jgi:serine/threonine protein phosphatase PrpC